MAAVTEPLQAVEGSSKPVVAEPGLPPDGTTAVPVELIKRRSNGLRGTLAEELASDAVSVSSDSAQLLKFHGVYAQDNRDTRRSRAIEGNGLDHSFMVRVAIPGGRLSAAQWLALDACARELADGSLRLTTRQAVQFHVVRKTDLRDIAGRLDAHLLTSFGACGDVVRNVVACHTLADHPVYGKLADELARRFKPTTSAHWEVFVDGAAVARSHETDALYGDAYLPRKFKVSLASPHENCVDALAQDVGLVPMDDLGTLCVFVGGGLGRSYSHPDTFARLGDPIGLCPVSGAADVLEAIVTAYRDLGARTDRRRARLKYLVADVGPAAFRALVEERLGRSLDQPEAPPRMGPADDHLGWRARSDGSWQLGVRVGAGRVRDDGVGLATALRELAHDRGVGFFVTAQQDVVIDGVDVNDRAAVARTLANAGVPDIATLGGVERTALACPALPTCSLALTEAERALPGIVRDVENSLESRGMGGRSLQLRVTGCPNGCARPAVAEVGLVGRTKTSYDVFLGGSPRGDRLARLVAERVSAADVPAVLEPWFDRWREEGDGGESFGDFVARVQT
jgi:sulfite reductase (ferredoxin)